MPEGCGFFWKVPNQLALNFCCYVCIKCCGKDIEGICTEDRFQLVSLILETWLFLGMLFFNGLGVFAMATSRHRGNFSYDHSVSYGSWFMVKG